MSVEQEIKKLEKEIKAIKSSFEQSAATMDVYTSEIEFSTSPNIITWNDHGNWEPFKYAWLDSIQGMTQDSAGNRTGYGRERFIVTFDCPNGNNTFASIEFQPINQGIMPIVWTKRVPYDNGAKWEVLVWDNGKLDEYGNYTWYPNTFKIAVQSAFPGTLGAKMIWQ